MPIPSDTMLVLEAMTMHLEQEDMMSNGSVKYYLGLLMIHCMLNRQLGMGQGSIFIQAFKQRPNLLNALFPLLYNVGKPCLTCGCRDYEHEDRNGMRHECRSKSKECNCKEFQPQGFFLKPVRKPSKD